MAEKPTFEAQINELEEIVKKLEGGEVSLEESIELFEKGVALSKNCQSALSEAEKKVNVLLGTDGPVEKENFIPTEE